MVEPAPLAIATLSTQVAHFALQVSSVLPLLIRYRVLPMCFPVLGVKRRQGRVVDHQQVLGGIQEARPKV